VVGLIRDDPIIGRLHVEYLDTFTGKKAVLQLHRRQWEQVLADVFIRATKAKGEKDENPDAVVADGDGTASKRMADSK
jgi:hypothetical protein